MKACSFFGHRNIMVTQPLIDELKRLIEVLIKNNDFGVFYFGEFGQFDDICYQVVTELKNIYPHIQRVYISPDEKSLSKHKIKGDKEYEFQTIFALKFNWWYQRIYYRNVSIIDNSDYVIFFVAKNIESGAYKAMQYATKNKKEYLNIIEYI